MLTQRRRRCASIKTTLVQRRVSAGEEHCHNLVSKHVQKAAITLSVSVL